MLDKLVLASVVAVCIAGCMTYEGSAGDLIDSDPIVNSDPVADNQAPVVSDPTVVGQVDGPGQVSLFWNMAADEISGAVDLEYAVFVAGTTAALETPSAVDQNGTLAFEWNANLDSAQVTDIDPGVEYKFAVVVRDAAGNRAVYTPVTYATPGDGTWIALTGGSYMMGSPPEAEYPDGDTDERPQHNVTLSDFHLLESEVTVAQYNLCLTEGDCTEEPDTAADCNWNAAGKEEHPLNCLYWADAVTYCTWLGGRLPTEAEWKYAARSQGQDQIYPWGDDPADCSNAVINTCPTGTQPVCSKEAGKTDQGLCDMAGNLFEMVEDDWHADYSGAPDDGTAWIDTPLRSAERVTCGGYYGNGALWVRAAIRNKVNFGVQAPGIGFRCAK